MTDTKSLWAETFGTFWLVFGGCGSAVFAAAFPALGIGFAGVRVLMGLNPSRFVVAGNRGRIAMTFALFSQATSSLAGNNRG